MRVGSEFAAPCRKKPQLSLPLTFTNKLIKTPHFQRTWKNSSGPKLTDQAASEGKGTKGRGHVRTAGLR